MGAVIVVSIAAFVFLVMSIALFCGKGSWLIAGFNTTSADKKTSFDEKKLCRAAAVLCLVVAVLLVVMAFLGYRVETGAMPESGMLPFALVSIIVVVSTLLLVIQYMNTRCKSHSCCQVKTEKKNEPGK